ncbi:hypothetical protein NCAS_0C01590 [Naumovozyma castellii]|uniref:non-specific serine/threonine protein kinase n=1 Tax=Naumovozyma castellii TaxID=27288 RepID=G0VCE0_NAUCA|nr:hypothetical protein NCAS_0C01590 [Naumovozyma castellii CBS 4309]CCC69149.1 hypothetical protein NCAS_0C01590 [Naumovozyma castellii CBS 4309]
MTTASHRHTYYGGDTITFQLPGKVPPARDDTPRNIPLEKRKHVTFGPYIIGSTLGEGEFGKVKLGWPKNSLPSSSSGIDVPKQVAIKLIRRDTISKDSSKEIKIYREINALKHLTHPNIVKLEEVLQNSKYIGIVLEYASGGEFYKYIQRKKRLKEGPACRLFAQLINGVHYIHSKGLVHRDLKLENLLLDKHENLIITDFGFVSEFYSHGELMKTSCGSPCYAAPELVVSTKPYEAKKADIWSCGVILYAMLAGYLPWDDDAGNPDGDDISRLYHYITQTPLKFPDYINPIPRDLLRRILISDPRRRITIKYIEKHEWLKPHSAFLSITPEEWDTIMHKKFPLRSPKSVAKYSKRPISTCSTSSTGSKNDKRGSLIIDSTLMTFPVPPQESQSHVLTKPSSPSPEHHHSPIKNTKLHSRSNSAASIALQAVVDTERDYVLSHDSFMQPLKPIPPVIERRSPIQARRTSVYSGTHPFSLMNRDNTIIETSPIRPSNNEKRCSSLYNESETLVEQPFPPSTDEAIVYPNHSFNNVSIRLQQKNNIHSNNLKNMHHGPPHHRKPRPTSYHPGSSMVAMSMSSPTHLSPPLLSVSPISLSSTTQTSSALLFDTVPNLEPTTSTSLTLPSPEGSPKMMARHSFTMSKPSLDLQSVSGDLIRSKHDSESVTKIMHDQVDDIQAKKKKEPQKKVKNDLPSEERKQIKNNPTSKLTNMEEMTTPVNRPDSGPQISLRKGSNSSDSRKPEKKRFSLMSFYSLYNSSKSSVNSHDSKTSSIRKISSTSTKAQQSRINEIPLKDSTNKPHYPKKDNKKTIPTHSFNGKKNVRSSIMISSLPEEQSTLHAQLRQPHEQSTTRRVIEFFKRRSMRV